jgi:hypothetical protein
MLVMSGDIVLLQILLLCLSGKLIVSYGSQFRLCHKLFKFCAEKSFRRVASCPDTKKLVKQRDPVHEVCDIKVKIADLGNACWSVSIVAC